MHPTDSFRRERELQHSRVVCLCSIFMAWFIGVLADFCRLAIGAAFLTTSVSACGSSDPASPDLGPTAATELVISAIPPQTVLRNTLSPRSVEIAVDVSAVDEGSDAPRAFTISLTSDDASVVADVTRSCTENPCAISLTPSPDRSAEVTVTLAIDANGARAVAQFQLATVAHLVRDRADGDPAPIDSLRDLVTKGEDGDVIAFDTEGAFSEARTIALEQPIVLDKDITIEGHGADRIAVGGAMLTGLFVIGNSSRAVFRDITLKESLQIEPGGAINVEPASELTLERCVVTSNEGELGAAIHAMDATVTIDASELTDNSTSGDGGAVHASGGLLRIVNGSSLSRNVSMGSGGAIAVRLSNQELVISDSTFRQNVASWSGGAIYASGANVTASNSMFAENQSQEGSAISAFSSSLTVDDSEVRDNDATATSEGGGAIFVKGGPGELVLRGSLVTGTTGHGAAVAAAGQVVTMEDTEISGTRTAWIHPLGGGVSLLGSKPGSVVRRSRIVDNHTTGVGGGVYVEFGDLLIEDSEIADNFAEGNGGGVLTRASLTISNSLISGNRSSNGGGGLFVRTQVARIDLGTRVVGNTALDGGGAHVAEFGELIIEDSVVGDRGQANMADFGGGVYVRGRLGLLGAMISDNGANLRGGGVAVVATTPSVSVRADLENASRIEANFAPFGGGLWVNGGAVFADDDVAITGNEVSEEFGGGGMYVEGGGNACDVPFNRVIGNRGGTGLENNIEPMLLCL